MTVERVKKMAVCHFFTPQEAVGSSGGEERATMDGPKTTIGNRTYRLVLVREARPLAETNSIQLEQLMDNDELLLVERREPPPVKEPTAEETAAPTKEEIATATTQLPKKNDNRDPDASHPSVDFQTEFRQILVTMIEASVRLISADPESDEVFNQILDKLDRRHRPRVDRNALRQLTEMGFPEAKATKALQDKRDVMEAMEWLLAQGNVEHSESDGIVGVNSGASTDSKDNGTIDHLSSASNMSNDHPQDPAEKVLNTFLQYRKKWFQPNPQAVQKLLQMGFKEEDIINALRVTGNKQSAACDLLLRDRPLVPDDQGLDRDSPIISAILASPVIQLALPKPKTLLALMMLYESPNNANMWLSDPDTHPVVSQVLRIYHAEKHSLSQSRPPASSGSTESTTSTSSWSSTSSSETGICRTLGRPGLPSRTSSYPSVNSSMFPVNSDGPSRPQLSSIPTSMYSPFSHLRNSGNDHTSFTDWLPSNSSSAQSQRRSSPSSSPVPTPRVNASPNSSPIPSHHLPLNREEPMSHSGSPIRGTVGVRGTTEIPNGVTPELTMTLGSSSTGQTPIYGLPLEQYTTLPSTVSIDVEMGEPGIDAQDMET
ncbi:ubiquitin-associated domain-containing protein 1-like isoform X2 [Homarus americanus]|nr:ubiquitin-associated domain-containing protein 1-like isoform X2 [Homarus americanus]